MGREGTRVLSTQTDGQLKSIIEGGFSLQHHRESGSLLVVVINVCVTNTRKRGLLFERSGHAWHSLLLPSSERPSSSFD